MGTQGQFTQFPSQRFYTLFSIHYTENENTSELQEVPEALISNFVPQQTMNLLSNCSLFQQHQIAFITDYA